MKITKVYTKYDEIPKSILVPFINKIKASDLSDSVPMPLPDEPIYNGLIDLKPVKIKYLLEDVKIITFQG